jgi:hypothetical protein
MLILCPITLKEACAFVSRVHRHHRTPQGGLFAVAASDADEVVGVAIIGRPVSRMLDDGWTAEVTRLATDGTKNCCSMLYAAAWRSCRALGYRKLITYILNTEPGTSLTAAGWKCVGSAGGGNWTRASRPRVDLHPTQGKLKFEMTAENGARR